MNQMTKEQECVLVKKNLPLFRLLLKSKKISTKEKLRVFENKNIDLKTYLKEIGEIN